MRVTTRSPHPPAKPLPAGHTWRWIGTRPLTGLPTGPDGKLLLCHDWESTGPEPAAPAEPAAQDGKRAKRGLVQASTQQSLFPD